MQKLIFCMVLVKYFGKCMVLYTCKYYGTVEVMRVAKFVEFVELSNVSDAMLDVGKIWLHWRWTGQCYQKSPTLSNVSIICIRWILRVYIYLDSIDSIIFEYSRSIHQARFFRMPGRPPLYDNVSNSSLGVVPLRIASVKRTKMSSPKSRRKRNMNMNKKKQKQTTKASQPMNLSNIKKTQTKNQKALLKVGANSAWKTSFNRWI